MKSKLFCCVLAIVGWSTPLFAADPVKMEDTSYRDADGHRVQQLTVVIDAPVKKVWDAFTTDAGFESWAVPVAHITLGNDGMMESSYRLTAKIGDPDNIKNRIVAYLPEKLLVIRNEHVPKGAPFDPVLIASIRTIMQFEDLGDGRTRVTESGVGYGEGADYDTMYAHFRAGNAEEFTALAQSFVTGPVDWKAEAAKMVASVHKPVETSQPGAKP
ncbi:MAG: SRPBCC domain-containing protein [Rhizomicrobium sp.]|jgi:uncharacterized protein YndB with AHSA1/START domain